MPGATVNFPKVPNDDRTVAVLAVSPNAETLARLRGIFQHTKWVIHDASDCKASLNLLKKREIPVVICERRMPDGTWKDLLEKVNALAMPPLVIVTSHDADDALWSEVLNEGGYDVLAKPFVSSEVTRIVSLAWLHWKSAREKRKKKAGHASASGSGTGSADPHYHAAGA
jgi:DNA-binding NtrC family response regulator